MKLCDWLVFTSSRLTWPYFTRILCTFTQQLQYNQCSSLTFLGSSPLKQFNSLLLLSSGFIYYSETWNTDKKGALEWKWLVQKGQTRNKMTNISLRLCRAGAAVRKNKQHLQPLTAELASQMQSQGSQIHAQKHPVSLPCWDPHLLWWHPQHKCTLLFYFLY